MLQVHIYYGQPLEKTGGEDKGGAGQGGSGRARKRAKFYHIAPVVIHLAISPTKYLLSQNQSTLLCTMKLAVIQEPISLVEGNVGII